MKESRVETIYRLKRMGYTNEEIAKELDTSVNSISGTISSEKYRDYKENQDEYWELLRKKSPEQRTRELVNRLLESAEETIASCGSAQERMKHVGMVKDLVGIVGISADDNTKMNVALVGEFGEEEFNRLINGTEEAVASDLRTDDDDSWKDCSFIGSQPDATTLSGEGGDKGISKVCTGDSNDDTHKGQSPTVEPDEGRGNETPALSQSTDFSWDDVSIGSL